MGENLYIFNFSIFTIMKKNLQLVKDKNGYQFFFLKLGMFIFICFMIDISIGTILRSLYLKQNSGWEYRTKYAVEATTADMLLFGSSRAQQQYNPTFFESRLNLSCYNVGRDGESILYQYTIFSSVINRYKPKIILLECENGMFRKTSDSYDKLSCFLPFYKTHPEIQSMIELRGPNEKLKLMSKMYPYNSLILKMISGVYYKNKNEDIKGYLPLYGNMNEPMRPVNYTKTYDLDSNKIKFYNSFIDICKRDKIELILVCSPYFSKGTGNDISLTMAKNIALKNDVKFIDLSKGHPLLNQSTLYDDTAHVNLIGAKILSNIVIDSMKVNKYLESSKYMLTKTN